MSFYIFFKIFLLSIIEGVTEFVPVSSTGHLILFNKIINLPSENIESIQISIQLGAILAVFFMYKKKLYSFVSTAKDCYINGSRIFVAVIPVFIVGFLFYDGIKLLFDPIVVAIGLIIGSFFMIMGELYVKNKPLDNGIEKITLRKSIIVGLFQVMAIIPGMSRSGSTIVGGLFAKLNHKTAADFTFLLGVPVIAAAVGYDLLKTGHNLTYIDWTMIISGSIMSFFIACLAIKFFIRFLCQYKLIPFAIYRLLLGLSIIFIIKF